MLLTYKEKDPAPTLGCEDGELMSGLSWESALLPVEVGRLVPALGCLVLCFLTQPTEIQLFFLTSWTPLSPQIPGARREDG